MMEMNFELVAVDDLLRGPGDRNAGTRGRHHHEVAIVSALQKSDVAIMRKIFGHSSRFAAVSKITIFGACMRIEFVLCMEWPASDGNPRSPAMLRNFHQTQHTVPRKAFW